MCRIAESQSPQDLTFQSPLAFTRLMAQSALGALKEAGFSDGDLPSLSGMPMILNRLGYRLRKVAKAKPLKKLNETDAIFEHVKKRPSSQRLRRACCPVEHGLQGDGQELANSPGAA